LELCEIEPRRILLVDDDQGVRQAISLLLSIDNHTVSTAADAAEALDLLKGDRFDLVITDFDMPGMHGRRGA
jgi:CheY-like chemotaxis protein